VIKMKKIRIADTCYNVFPLNITHKNAEYMHAIDMDYLMAVQGSVDIDNMSYFGIMDIDIFGTTFKQKFFINIFWFLNWLINAIFNYPISRDRCIYVGNKTPIYAGVSVLLTDYRELPEEIKNYCKENNIRLLIIQDSVWQDVDAIYIADTPIPISEMSVQQRFAAREILENEVLTAMIKHYGFDIKHCVTNPPLTQAETDWTNPLWVDAQTDRELINSGRGYEYGLFE